MLTTYFSSTETTVTETMDEELAGREALTSTTPIRDGIQYGASVLDRFS